MVTSLSLIASITALILSIFGNISKFREGWLLLKKWKQKQANKWSMMFDGCWDNLLQIRHKPTHYVSMRIWGYAKNFEGKYNVRNRDDVDSWEMFDIVGTRSRKTLECNIVKNHEGVKILVARGTLKKVDGILQFRLKESFSDQFPAIAILQKGIPPLV